VAGCGDEFSDGWSVSQADAAAMASQHWSSLLISDDQDKGVIAGPG
jgi:hypothetical protein